MSTDSTRLDAYHYGALRGKLIATLAGTSPNRLASWSRRGLLEASFIKGRRGVPRLYSWVDYQKARAMVALLEQGVSAQRLGQQIAVLDEEVNGWWKLPLLAFQGHVIVPNDDGLGYTIVEKQGAADKFIRDALLVPRDIASDDVTLAIEIAHALRDEGPLGRLSEFDQYVTMDPKIQDGHPIIRGRRIETGMLLKLHEWGSSVSEMADRFTLTFEQVQAAIAFEDAIAA